MLTAMTSSRRPSTRRSRMSSMMRPRYSIIPCTLDLTTAIEDTDKALNYFLNNKVIEARELLERWAESSMYHALGSSGFKLLEAMLTFEPEHIETATEAVNKCIAICHHYRRKVSISKTLWRMLRRINYDSYTPEEIHAELCYAESMCMMSVLTIIQGDSIFSFIKAGLLLRSCYSSFKECKCILDRRNWNEENHKVPFECGVRMGIGAFSLGLSILPPKVLKLFKMVGCSGSKEDGLRELENAYQLKASIRHFACITLLLVYHLIFMFLLSHSEGDLAFCEELIESQLQLYPNGSSVLLFKGRLEFVKGNVDDCIHWYSRLLNSQDLWPPFHPLCNLNLMLANCMKQAWREASAYADHLMVESKLSKTLFYYQKAVMLIMLGDELSCEETQEIEELMRTAPQYKQVISGKHIPIETFAVKKCKRFFAQKKQLVLPGLELLYVLNLVRVLGKNWKLVEAVYQVVDETLANLNDQKSEYHADNRGLVLLLKAACLRQMESPLEAEECLKEVVVLQKKIKEDLYLVPFALVELALLYKDQGDDERAASLLEDTKKHYSSYSLEAHLHVKILTAELELREKKTVKAKSIS